MERNLDGEKTRWLLDVKPEHKRLIISKLNYINLHLEEKVSSAVVGISVKGGKIHWPHKKQKGTSSIYLSPVPDHLYPSPRRNQVTLLKKCFILFSYHYFP